jgi:transposase
VSNVIDAECSDLLAIAKDRGSEAQSEQITYIVMDMSPAYIAGAMEYFPGARVVFDAFHIMS